MKDLEIHISIDDDQIIRKIEDKAISQVKDNIAEKLEERIWKKSYYGRKVDPKYDPISNETKNMLKEFFEDHKDEIVEATAKHLANRLLKTKQVKEVVGDILEDYDA